MIHQHAAYIMSEIATATSKEQPGNSGLRIITVSRFGDSGVAGKARKRKHGYVNCYWVIWEIDGHGDGTMSIDEYWYLIAFSLRIVGSPLFLLLP